MGEPVYSALGRPSLTTMGSTSGNSTRVWSCPACAHMRGEPLQDTEAFYDNEYRISLDHEDEDQVYEVDGSRITYRTEHQARTLLANLPLPAGATLLDYGCAKATTLGHVRRQRPDLALHLFDVSERYRPHWERVAPADRCATYSTPARWQGSFEAVTSFFVLEHVPAPRTMVGHVASLLRPDGVFYGVVPDTFGNVADFLVADHVNHFTVPSLHRLLGDAGFTSVEIDANAHRGALVFIARRQGARTLSPAIGPVRERSLMLARYWQSLAARLRVVEEAAGDIPAAIYGSGFYGGYIATQLSHPQRIRCFLDISPFRQGQSLLGKPIVAPSSLPTDVRTLYVGLNPTIARQAFAQQSWLDLDRVRLVFLDDEAT